MSILKRIRWIVLFIPLAGLAVYFLLPQRLGGLPEVVGDADPILKTERRFNDSISVVKRNETISEIGSKWRNYYWNGEWLDIDTTLTQIPDGFCADKMPFKFCAPLRSTGEAIFTANNQYDIFGMKEITDSPLEERMTAVGVNDVAGQLITGNIMMSNGVMNDVQYVLYPGAYNDADLIYYVNYGRAPRLAQLVKWNIKPTCSLPLTRTFISKYSAPVEIVNGETRTKWNQTGQLQLAGEPLRIASNQNRGIGKKPFHIWDSDEKGLMPKSQRIDVKIVTAPGQNAYALTKILPCAFFSTAIYPVYTDTTDTFSPDADPETNTVDGRLISSNVPGISWTNIRAAGGTTAVDNTLPLVITINDQEEAGSGFKVNERSVMAFNTGPTIPAANTISSATLTLRAISKTSPTQLNALDTALTGNTGSWTTSLVAGNYTTPDSVRNADTDVTYANVTAGADSSWTLNSTGISNIAKGSGISRFSIQSSLDLADSPAPSTSDNSTENGDDVRWESADNTNDPVLSVTHALGGGFEDSDVIETIYWKLYDLKVALYYSILNTAYAVSK